MEVIVDESEITPDTRRRRFIQKHGGIHAPRRRVDSDGDPLEHFVMPTGALLPVHPLGMNIEPPANTLDRLRLMMEYREIILAEVTAEVAALVNAAEYMFQRQSFRGTYNGPSYIGTQEEVLANLEALKLKQWRAINHCRAVREKIDDLLKPPEKTMDELILEKQLENREDQFWRKVKKLTA